MTLIESVLQHAEGTAQFNENYEAKPACILWPDKDRLWEPLTPAFRQASPYFFQLGEFAPERCIGPALWLKCVLAGVISDHQIPNGSVPILYLPGVSRSDFREAESCASALQPLIELQYRGVIWSHPNGKDWTVYGFLSSNDGGLGLDVAKDNQTSVALQQALTKLGETPIQRLQGQQIDADFLLALLHPDPGRQLLVWLNDPSKFRQALSSDEWNSFVAVCRGTYRFDPEKDGEIRAAELLGEHKGAWRETWSRFKEAPHRYPGIPEWLRRACPPKQMELALAEKVYDDVAEAWPQINDEAERDLREVLSSLPTVSQKEIRHSIITIARQHAPRTDWVWAELGKSSLARMWPNLTLLAESSEKPLSATNLNAFATAYDTEGWKVDAAVVGILSDQLAEGDRSSVEKVVRALYLPWLEESALNFQRLAKQEISTFRISPPSKPPPGTVLLFADALRLDVGQMLFKELQTLGLECSLVGRWSAIPSVTPTAKPAVSLVAHLLGSDLAPDKQDVMAFRPSITSDNKSLTPDRFRKLLDGEGVQFLTARETGDPNGLGWTEHGRLDADGHHEGSRITLRCQEHVRILAERIESLLQAGWKNVRVVTDHGWLLVPGGLPKVDLPKFLTETRWGRCAVLTDAAHSELATFPWSWSPAVQIVCAPGVGSFLGGLEYAHGGLSPQECRIPEIQVRGSATAATLNVRIASIKWVNLRCRVTLQGDFSSLTVDLRLRPADAGSSVVEAAKAPDASGVASLVLVRDELVGDSASAVVLASDGSVVQKLSLVLGEDSP